MSSSRDQPERNDSQSTLDREGSGRFMMAQISRIDWTAARDRLGSSFRSVNLGTGSGSTIETATTATRENRISIGSAASGELVYLLCILACSCIYVRCSF